MKLDDIIISDDLLKSNPSQKKIDKVYSYYMRTGKLDKPIRIVNGELVDGYIRYLVLRSVNYKNDIENAFPLQTVVYGVHKASDKQYKWRDPNNQIGILFIGDKVLVDTKYGKSIVTVTKVAVEHAETNTKLRRVIKKL